MRKVARLRRGDAIYTCSDCGKRTRETGSGESHAGRCLTCLNAVEALNDWHDGSLTEAEFYKRLESIGYQGKAFTH
jgi:hypothetical protein